MNEDLVAEIGAAQFAVVRFREGYDMGEVDTFLDALAAAVAAGGDVGDLISRARFSPVRIREGYDMRAVDDVLAGVERQMRAPERRAGRPVPPSQPATRRATRPGRRPDGVPSVVEEQRGLLSRLLGRGC